MNNEWVAIKFAEIKSTVKGKNRVGECLFHQKKKSALNEEEGNWTLEKTFFRRTLDSQKSQSWCTQDSVTRLGDFLNFLVAYFITQVTQMFGDFWGSFENHCFLSQTGESTFWAIFGKTWATLISNIRPHTGTRQIE